jgi:hypothetical protein
MMEADPPDAPRPGLQPEDWPDPAAAAVPGIPPEPDPIAPAAPVLRAYDLPGARQVVTYGLTLAYRATSELRRASLYIGLLTLAILGPPIVLAIEVITKLHLTDPSAIERLRDPAVAGTLLQMIALLYLAIAGWVAVAIDAQLIAVSLLAARAGERPYSLRDAVRRARQVFWRLVRGGIIAGLVVVIVELVLSGIFVGIAGLRGFDEQLATVIATLMASPLGYLSTGIVLGDVSAIEALRRSVGLARARPRVAIVVALFVVVTNAIQSFALGAGLELVFDGANALHVDPNGGAASLVVTILIVLALVMAFGSLTFTISAIVAAPQVAAFLGLTFYSAGLDRALVVDPSRPRFRWVTRPMAALIVILVVFSALGVLSVQQLAVP